MSMRSVLDRASQKPADPDCITKGCTNYLQLPPASNAGTRKPCTRRPDIAISLDLRSEKVQRNAKSLGPECAKRSQANRINSSTYQEKTN